MGQSCLAAKEREHSKNPDLKASSHPHTHPHASPRRGMVCSPCLMVGSIRGRDGRVRVHRNGLHPHHIRLGHRVDVMGIQVPPPIHIQLRTAPTWHSMPSTSHGWEHPGPGWQGQGPSERSASPSYPARSPGRRYGHPGPTTHTHPATHCSDMA